MKKYSIVYFSFAILLFGCNQKKIYSDYPITMLGIRNVKLSDNLWLPKIKTIQNTTIVYGFEKCRSEGRLENFLIAGGKKKGNTYGKMPFDDTDIYKIVEGASNSLISASNKELEQYLDSVISIIQIGQELDGYITTWFTIDPDNPPAPWVAKSGKRWTREQSSHELYNSGHLFEAAVAHYLATGKRNFLDIAIKNADLLVNNFGPNKLRIPPGHQIVETGLIKLYIITKNEKYLNLAKSFLDWRGDSTTHKLYGEYSQDHKPVTKQDQIVGHAVRAVYMYAAMTDIAAIYKDSDYLDAIVKIWDNMVERKIYLTGAIGAKHDGESLGSDYELPNLTAYGETCASIGNVFWNTRLFQFFGDSKYFDVIERILYNGLISGISLDGKNFFYVNPLEADGKFKFNSGSLTRQSWFDCSCCPTNLIRFIPSIPGLIYAQQKDTLYVNLYISNTANIELGNSKLKLTMQTGYPWDGDVRIKINSSIKKEFTLKLRLPGWTHNKVLSSDLYSYSDKINQDVVIKLNGVEEKYNSHLGYVIIARAWQEGDEVYINFPMNLRRIVANERIKDDQNLTALEYGPIVYCAEGIDNNDQLEKINLTKDLILKIKRRDDLLGGINIIVGEMNNRNKENKFMAIPYYAWSNRGIGTMKVWFPGN